MLLLAQSKIHAALGKESTPPSNKHDRDFVHHSTRRPNADQSWSTV